MAQFTERNRQMSDSPQQVSVLTSNPDAKYRRPEKLVKSADLMSIWTSSKAYQDLLLFISRINESIKGRIIDLTTAPDGNVASVLRLIQKLFEMIQKHPPVKQTDLRYGNTAFKTWFSEMQENVVELLQEMLPKQSHPAIVEIAEYLTGSFGNEVRIDYGTGHETSFIIFLLCLEKIGFLGSNDWKEIGLSVFPKYLELVQTLQKTYKMEPAGSRGCHGVDDFQHLPFYLGSAQLVGNDQISPRAILSVSEVEKLKDKYMYFNCIHFINQVKSGPFHEHSTVLYQISNSESWQKINGGFYKAYIGEVLSKNPVVQHIPFGTLFSLDPVRSSINH